MKPLIELVVKRLSDHPEQARVTEYPEGRTTVYEVEVTKRDRGRIFGGVGRPGRALRDLVGAGAGPRGRKVSVRIRD